MSPPRGGTEVVCEHVRKMFEGGRIRALEDISLTVGAGEFVALTGRSGCGKSTLLNLIGALDRPDAGTITVGGRSLAEIHDLAAYRAGDRRVRVPVPLPDPDAVGALERPDPDDRDRALGPRARGPGTGTAR